MKPFCLVDLRSQDASTNAGVLSVYLTTILCRHQKLFIDIERENIPCVHSLLGRMLKVPPVNPWVYTFSVL